MLRWTSAAAIVFLTMANARAVAASADAQPKVPFLSPTMAPEEIQEYRKVSNDKAAVAKFIATRAFLRRLTAYVAELPQGAVYDSVRDGSPQPDALVSIQYALTFDEQMLVYNACLVCGGCDSGGEPTGAAMCGLTHPKTFDCGTPAAKETVLQQLAPPVSHEDVALFEKANRCTRVEIPKFLATRLYLREIKKLLAAAPPGKQFDPRSAPPLPDGFDPVNYAVHDGTDNELDDAVTSILKQDVEDRVKAGSPK